MLGTEDVLDVGGDAADIALAEAVLGRERRQHPERAETASLERGSRAWQRLVSACERARIALSTSPVAVLSVDDLWPGVDLECEVSGSFLGRAIGPAVAPIVDCIVKAVKASAETKGVLLHGGLCSTPRVQSMITAAVGPVPIVFSNVAGSTLGAAKVFSSAPW